MKIKCVEKMTDVNWFTVGEVYKVVGGVLHDNQGYTWENCYDINSINDQLFRNRYRFELVTEEPSTPSKPTKEQLVNLKPGDKVRLRSDRGPIWNSDGRMDMYCDKVVTIKYLDETMGRTGGFRIVRDKWIFELTDIVEIISSEPEPIPEPIKPAKPWKESLIDQINQLPYEGGIINFAVSERERARIIELINAM